MSNLVCGAEPVCHYVDPVDRVLLSTCMTPCICCPSSSPPPCRTWVWMGRRRGGTTTFGQQTGRRTIGQASVDTLPFGQRPSSSVHGWCACSFFLLITTNTKLLLLSTRHTFSAACLMLIVYATVARPRSHTSHRMHLSLSLSSPSPKRIRHS